MALIIFPTFDTLAFRKKKTTTKKPLAVQQEGVTFGIRAQLITQALCSFDFVVFNIILGPSGAIVSKWHVIRKWQTHKGCPYCKTDWKLEHKHYYNIWDTFGPRISVNARCDGNAGLSICDFPLFFNSKTRPKSAPLRDISLPNLRDLKSNVIGSMDTDIFFPNYVQW